jgi:hypothetical protein
MLPSRVFNSPSEIQNILWAISTNRRTSKENQTFHDVLDMDLALIKYRKKLKIKK